MHLRYYEFIAEKLHPAELVVFVKKCLRIRRRYFSFNNLNFFIDPVSHFGLRILRDKMYEPQVTSFVEQLLLPGDVFMDLGANEGYFSIIASKIVGDNGKVFCIEPQRRLWPVLLDNFIANECHNIQLLPYAVGPEKGEAELILTPSINTGSSKIKKSVRTTFWAQVRKDDIAFSVNRIEIRSSTFAFAAELLRRYSWQFRCRKSKYHTMCQEVQSVK